MAKKTFDPEIKQAMKETPADKARDKKRGIKEGSPQDQQIDAQPGNQIQARPQQMPMQHGAVAQTPVDLHHVNAAASIAHAILGNRGM